MRGGFTAWLIWENTKKTVCNCLDPGTKTSRNNACTQNWLNRWTIQGPGLMNDVTPRNPRGKKRPQKHIMVIHWEDESPSQSNTHFKTVRNYRTVHVYTVYILYIYIHMNPYKSNLYTWKPAINLKVFKVFSHWKKGSGLRYIHCQPRWGFYTSIIQVVGVGSFWDFTTGSIRVNKNPLGSSSHVLFSFHFVGFGFKKPIKIAGFERTHHFSYGFWGPQGNNIFAPLGLDDTPLKKHIIRTRCEVEWISVDTSMDSLPKKNGTITR